MQRDLTSFDFFQCNYCTVWVNRPFSYSTKEPGSSDIFIHFIREVRLMALELRSQLCTFEISTKCNEISFDPHSFSE